jgi:single-strand DNA-binding protein
MDSHVTIVGNLTADPELRFTTNGTAVANFTIASTPRRFDKTTESWVDGETTFLRGTLWRGEAENAAESLTKGDRVIAVGSLSTSAWTDKDGADRTTIELRVEEIGPSLKWRTATVNRVERATEPARDTWDAEPEGATPPRKLAARKTPARARAAKTAPF